MAERAIGTWVDPNALGGILATAAIIIVPQVIAKRPVLPWRWLTFGSFALVGLALLLTFSRASFLALGAGLLGIALVRYRRLLPALFVGGLLLFCSCRRRKLTSNGSFKPFKAPTWRHRCASEEWTDSLEVIGRYPLFGVGFTGAPEIDIYANVANMYLMMANQIGLTGVVVFLLAMAGVFLYGHRAWHAAKDNPEIAAIHLGFHAALFTGLVNAPSPIYIFFASISNRPSPGSGCSSPYASPVRSWQWKIP